MHHYHLAEKDPLNWPCRVILNWVFIKLRCIKAGIPLHPNFTSKLNYCIGVHYTKCIYFTFYVVLILYVGLTTKFCAGSVSSSPEGRKAAALLLFGKVSLCSPGHGELKSLLPSLTAGWDSRHVLSCPVSCVRPSIYIAGIHLSSHLSVCQNLSPYALSNHLS